MTDTPPSRSQRRSPTGGLRFFWAPLLLAAGAAAFVALAYAPAFRNFFYDDELLYLAAAEGATSALYLFTTFIQGFPRPLVHAYFFITGRAFGVSAPHFYVVGAALFVANVCLFAAVAGKVLKHRGWGMVAGAFAAAAFYPYEAVYCLASGATEMICGVFYLGTLWAYLRYREAPTVAKGVLVCLGLALAYASKESALSLLPLMLAYDAVIRPSAMKKWTWWRLFVPLAVITAVYVGIEVYCQLQPSAPNRFKYGPSLFAFYNLTAGPLYILTAALPPALGWQGLSKVIPLLGGWTAAFVFLPGRRERLFGLLWVLITFLPFIFWQVPVVATMPRYMFLPAFGFALLAASSLRGLAALAGDRKWFYGVAAAALLAFAGVNALQIRSLAPRFLEPGERLRRGVEVLSSYKKPGKTLYLYKFELIRPWQLDAVNRLFFGDELVIWKQIPARADEGACLVTYIGGETRHMVYRGGRWIIP